MSRIDFGPAELETFLAVAELKSFSAAADRLSLSQPSISNRIQRLEASLGIKLFDRTARAIVLTEAGLKLRDRAGAIIGELQTILTEFKDEAKSLQWKISISASPMVSSVLLPKIIRKFTALHPDASVVLRDSFGPQAIADLRNGDVDVVVTVLEGDYAGLYVTPFLKDTCVVALPLDHSLAGESISFDELVKHPILLPSAQRPLADTIGREFEKRGHKFTPNMTVNSIYTVLGLVEANMGISIVSKSTVEWVNSARVRTATISDATIIRDFGAVTRSKQHTLRGVDLFVKLLQDEFSTSNSLS